MNRHEESLHIIVTREMPIQTVICYCHRSIRVPKTMVTWPHHAFAEDGEQLELSEVAGGRFQWHHYFGKTVWQFCKKLNVTRVVTQPFLSELFTQEKWKHYKNLYMNIHSKSICNSQKLETVQVLGPRKKYKGLAWGLLRWRLKPELRGVWSWGIRGS